MMTRAWTGRSGQPMKGGRWRQRVGWWQVWRWLWSWGGSKVRGCVQDDNVGDDDEEGDNNDHAINFPNTAAVNNNDDNKDDEGMPRKTLVTATIQRKIDAANADIPEGGALNRPIMKLGQ
jgi:hypothetical protein